ncbi:hypothetical protein K2173_003630 [Erythroxylum novogranatense]|uniref:Uncharacterized protein n=1 Tax=Erythroxylum novogranatense TaxID=1862640 RepID=A0AAV8TCL4_9ROSI|nr:hypothetical protein K2173_003630 [Erythroxylum novogranatense]
MAASKLAVFSLLLALILTVVRAGVAVDGSHDEPALQVGVPDGVDTSVLKSELEQLKSKIHVLESIIDNKAKELKSKDEAITQKEKIIQDKLDTIASLQDEVSLLQQKKGKLDAAEQVGKAHARAGELEKQIDKLKKEVETHQREKEALESRILAAEKKVDILLLKIDRLQETNEEQKSKLRKTERALKDAEEEMMKAKFEATSKTKELMEVHGAWLPPWLAVRLVYLQSSAQVHWHKHGKPAMELVMQKALEKKAQAEKWAEPHVETINSRWIPAAKEQWLVVSTHVKPHVHSLKTKTFEAYKASKTAITPHVIRAHEVVDPYFQEAKKFSKPYIDQVATVTKPHVDKVRVALKPYTKEAIRAYGKFLESATMYHHQMQGTVQETLKRHELTRAFATKELVWFVASALLALPVIILSRMCSAIFCKKAKKPTRNANNHPRRKAKRGHPEK